MYGESDGNSLDFWWLYALELGPDGLTATYDMSADGRGGQVLYSLDGEMLGHSFTES